MSSLTTDTGVLGLLARYLPVFFYGPIETEIGFHPVEASIAACISLVAIEIVPAPIIYKRAVCATYVPRTAAAQLATASPASRGGWASVAFTCVARWIDLEAFCLCLNAAIR